MKLKQLLYKINPINLIKEYWERIVVLIIVGGLAIVFTSQHIEDEIERSRNNLIYELRFPGNSAEFVSVGNGRTISQYKESSMPKNEDQSAYKQMYGGYSNYYEVNGDNCWSITVVKKISNTFWESYRIRPIAAATKYEIDPAEAFSDLYDNLLKEEKLNCSSNNDYFIKNFHENRSKYHTVNCYPINSGTESGSTWWHTFYNTRVFYEYNARKGVTIEEDDNAILFLYLTRYCFAVGIVALLFWLFFKIKNVIVTRRGENKIIQKSTFIPSSKRDIEITEELLESLLAKLHPSNYMSPYDAHKVRVANDLYEALQNNKGNKTMLEMIRDKAQHELGISFDGNEDHLLS